MMLVSRFKIGPRAASVWQARSGRHRWRWPALTVDSITTTHTHTHTHVPSKDTYFVALVLPPRKKNGHRRRNFWGENIKREEKNKLKFQKRQIRSQRQTFCLFFFLRVFFFNRFSFYSGRSGLMLLPSFVIYAAGHYFCVCGPVGSKSVAHRSFESTSTSHRNFICWRGEKKLFIFRRVMIFSSRSPDHPQTAAVSSPFVPVKSPNNKQTDKNFQINKKRRRRQ